jgi:hypothetical protein
MIIKLASADFSANNIGQLDFQRALSVDTVALLAHYTRELTNDQKFSVQDFIAGLVSEAIWTSIDNLYIPVLGIGIGEAFFNVKKGVLDFTPSATYYEMDSYGIRPKAGTTAVASANIAKATLGGSRKDYHMMVYVAHAAMNDSIEWDMPIMCNNGGVLAGLRGQRNTAANVFSISSYSSGSLSIQNVPSSEVISGFWGISSGQAKAVGLVNGYSGGQLNHVEADDATFTGKLASIGYQYADKPMMQTGMRIISTGRYLTEAQLAAYNVLCDALVEDICV